LNSFTILPNCLNTSAFSPYACILGVRTLCRWGAGIAMNSAPRCCLRALIRLVKAECLQIFRFCNSHPTRTFPDAKLGMGLGMGLGLGVGMSSCNLLHDCFNDCVGCNLVIRLSQLTFKNVAQESTFPEALGTTSHLGNLCSLC